MEQRTKEIINECKRQEESCLYTSTALFGWMKEVRRWRLAFIILPILAGSIAGAKILLKDQSFDWITAIAAMVAGLFPALFKALDLDVSVATISDSANRFKTLQDRFRQASRIGATRAIEDFETEFLALMARMDDARAASPPTPERHFNKAQKKIKKGDMTFDTAPNE